MTIQSKIVNPFALGEQVLLKLAGSKLTQWMWLIEKRESEFLRQAIFINTSIERGKKREAVMHMICQSDQIGARFYSFIDEFPVTPTWISLKLLWVSTLS